MSERERRLKYEAGWNATFGPKPVQLDLPHCDLERLLRWQKQARYGNGWDTVFRRPKGASSDQ